MSNFSFSDCSYCLMSKFNFSDFSHCLMSISNFSYSLAYSAPEILTPPDFSYSFAADIYALGCTIYAILTSREPFNDIRNPAYQLWCIRRGFWESGANPLLPTNARVSSPLSADAAKTPAHVSLSAPSGVLKSRMASYSTPASATTVDIVQKAVLDEVLIIVRFSHTFPRHLFH
jgi:serine/threonine protein kinase